MQSLPLHLHLHLPSLGTVDWRLDPAILGLERLTDFSLDYRIEQFVDKSSHLDRLLGSGWDYRYLFYYY